MSEYGGIFDATSVLGIPTSLSGEEQECLLSQWTKTEPARQLQQQLVQRGVQNLAIDGLWGPCSEAAFKMVFGVGTSSENLRKYADMDCVTFKQVVQGSCTNPAVYSPAPTQPRTTFASQLQPMSTMAAQAPSSFDARNIASFPESQSQQQYPPYTTEPVFADGTTSTPAPYHPPSPGADAGAQGAQQSSQWLKYGLIAGAVVFVGLGMWWWAGSGSKPAKPASLPSGRLRPVGTIE